ncbi:threonine aspartase 1 [Episyrphus balteatus]|uniref:threonine aspartase 1 n=1 Tax=Episyrphus balteatus TaxID=286459 RepID=UPI002485D4B9|nr:threonine aspartase 1 [Episyrphus balteatus]
MSGFVAVHTGAGNSIDETKYQRVIKEACIRANAILKNGGSSLDACEAAIIRLENCGSTNAGFGSNLTWDGKVQCEASIMDGSNLQFGACTNVSTVKNPIQLARIICDRQSKMLSMDRIPPMVLAGEGAAEYASEVGCSMIEADKMISSKAKICYNHYKTKVSDCENRYNIKINSLDTVGAICVDADGNCAAGCSSGGLILKVSGRVGQAATYGAGCWATSTADMSVATCTTGNGEYLMKTLLAKEICTDLMSSECGVTSLHKVFKQKFIESPFLPADQDLYGGALSLVFHPRSNCGEVIWSHTTKSFCLGFMSTEYKVPKFLLSPLPTYCTPGKSIVVNGQPFSFKN